MSQYWFSRRADNDLAGIAEYTIATFGISQARRYKNSLNHCFTMLAKNQLTGKRAEQFAPLLRYIEHQSHLVFYLPEKEGIRIVRVSHKYMDATSHL